MVSGLKIPDFDSGETLATRKAFGPVLDSIADSLPQLVGGSADLSHQITLETCEEVW